MTYVAFLGIGLVAGVFAGLFGLGGGLIIVPALIFLLGFNDKQAVGTSLAALIPPVGLLGAAEFYRSGFMSLASAALIAGGLFVGAYFGARIAIGLDPATFRRIYAAFLIVVALKMLISAK